VGLKPLRGGDQETVAETELAGRLATLLNSTGD
jgi:hypothetical protein